MAYKLPYINAESQVCESTPYGFMEYDANVYDKYKNAKARNYVILRIDLLDGFKDIFCEEVIEKYRGTIYSLLAGKLDNDTISKVMTILFTSDENFKVFLGTIYYFDYKEDEESLYVAIINKLLKRIKDLRIELTEMLNLSEDKVAFESYGYAYLAIRDVKHEVCLPAYCREEILSRAKVWTNNIKKEQ